VGSGHGCSTGVWTDSLRSSDYHVDFQIQPQATRSNRGEVPQGTWDVWFGDTDTLQPAEAQLDLTLKDGLLVGTIRTPTGDYRFFSGTCEEGVLHMQTYDGAHLYCVEAQLMNNQWVHGQFYSGNHYHTNWSATPGEVWVTDGVVELVQASETDLLINSFNAQGDPIQVSLVPLDNEVVVVDILGTWCPNCMDEVRLLRELRDNHPHIRVVSVAYERDTLPNDVFRRLAFYETQLDIDWEVYWGGRASKSIAASTFPFLHEVISFPTTLFIHPNGTVAIHSGFNGPATGAAYEQEKLRFNRLVATDLSL
jgi:thiol-disulfide isomerase/thioredoxin